MSARGLKAALTALLAGPAAANPRAVKMLYLAYQGQQAINNSRASSRPAMPDASPVPTVSGARNGPDVLSDRMPIDAWVRKRNLETRNRRK